MKNAKKSPLWIGLTVVVVIAALFFVRPQAIFPSEDLTYTQITANGQDVTNRIDQAALSQLLSQLQGSQMYSAPAEGQVSVSITGSCQGAPFTLVLGDNSAVTYDGTSYRIRSASDLLVEVYALLPEEVQP